VRKAAVAILRGERIKGSLVEEHDISPNLSFFQKSFTQSKRGQQQFEESLIKKKGGKFSARGTGSSVRVSQEEIRGD